MAERPQIGQHWLKDEPALKAMVQAAGVTAGDNVLEIGPGQGALTDKLAAAGANVTAVELDPQLVAKLTKTYQDSQRIRIVQSDILQFDLRAMPQDYKVAANIPYYLTAPILRMLITSPSPPSLIALLVQKEAAERLAAEPGEMSLISLLAQMFGTVSIGPTVPPSAFSPPPKVDSAIVVINRHRPAKPIDEAVLKLAKHGFANRRKTLANSLAAGLALDKDEIGQSLAEAGLPAKVRSQDLSLDQWQKLAFVLGV